MHVALVSAPKVMCCQVQSAISLIPLVKSKSGNLSDVNNLAIAISTAMSQLMESVIGNHVFSSTETEKYQFGFKAEHSTYICSSIFKHTVDYNVNHSSHVFPCFIDLKQETSLPLSVTKPLARLLEPLRIATILNIYLSNGM